MKIDKSIIVTVSAVLLLSTIPLSISSAASVRTDTFAVYCYDVGKAALQGQEGIVKVGSGLQGMQEVNRVTYDPQRTSREAIETRLKQSGTYRKTLGQAGQEKP